MLSCLETFCSRSRHVSFLIKKFGSYTEVGYYLFYTEACLTADLGVASSILAWSHTFEKYDHEIISTVILLPSAESFKKDSSVTSESMCMKYWLTACSSLSRKSVVR